MPVELTESLQDVVARSKLKNKSCLCILYTLHAAARLTLVGRWHRRTERYSSQLSI